MITKEQLYAAIPGASKTLCSVYAPLLSEAMDKFNINTKERRAQFIAQIAHESGSLHYTEEIASGKDYEHRKDLGNLTKTALNAAHAQGMTTGRFYKGHGLIQITGFYNHKKCGEALGIDLVNNPKLLTEPEYAALSAAWFFDTQGCNELADLGGEHGCKQVTRRINGGYNGLQDRLFHYDLAFGVCQ